MKKILVFIIVIYYGLINSLAFAESAINYSIKLALFDNPQPDPSRNEGAQEFLNSYMAGVNTAVAISAKKGVYITVRDFFHSNNLSNIIEQAANAKAWKPDVIMGLSTSNDFLMSKAFFGDQVILSISATDSSISSLPTGFYSLGIPDVTAVNAIIAFIRKNYANSNLFIAASAESKESVDFADLIAKVYKNKYRESRVIERKFLAEDISHLTFGKFMSGYQKGDIIIIMSIGYDSAVDLMNKITDYIKPIKPIFITSADNWGDSNTPINMVGSYNAFRIDTLTGGADTASYKSFLENYIKINGNIPKDKISFVTYQTVMSFVDASIKYYPKAKNISVKESLLASYEKALQKNHNWYRPPYYIVYKLENNKEVMFDKIT